MSARRFMYPVRLLDRQRSRNRMDLMHLLRRRVDGWQSAPGSGVPSRGLSPTSSTCSASTGPARTGLRSSSRAMRRPRRTSRRRRSCPRSGTSTVSTAAGRSRRGCTASSSTARSTGRARGSSAARWSSATTSRHRRRPFGPWLHRIVVNRAIDWTRARKLRAEVELGDYLPAPTAPERDGATLARIAELPAEHRAVVVLRYVLEYTPGEIAELLDLPRGTVNSRLRRGLDKLKERLE